MQYFFPHVRVFCSLLSTTHQKRKNQKFFATSHIPQKITAAYRVRHINGQKSEIIKKEKEKTLPSLQKWHDRSVRRFTIM